MKKLALIFTIVLGISLGTYAQNGGLFFLIRIINLPGYSITHLQQKILHCSLIFRMIELT